MRISILAMCFILFSGASFSQETKSDSLIIRYLELKEGDIVTDSLYTPTQEYLDLNLACMGPNCRGGYNGITDIVKDFDRRHYISIIAVQGGGSKTPIKFLSKADFLNFMSKNGYEVFSVKDRKYDWEFTFKRKK